MREYEKHLIETLRNNADHFMTTDYEWSNALVHLLLDSADAIEQKKERAEMVGLDGDICYLPNTLMQILISNPNMGAFKKETLCKAADTIEEMLVAVPHWISVEERLPEEWREVLTYSPIHSDEKNPHMIQLCWYIGFGKWRECQYGEIMEIPVTHWMPLPEPPKEVAL